MIVPIEFKTKEEIEESHKRTRELGRDGMIQLFFTKGWSTESAEILADAMLKLAGVKPEGAEEKMNTLDDSLDLLRTRIVEKGRNVNTVEDAKLASLFKWRIISSVIENFKDLTDVFCGFCYHSKNQLAEGKHIGDKCLICPTTVHELCDDLFDGIGEHLAEIENYIEDAINFFDAFEPEGEEEK